MDDTTSSSKCVAAAAAAAAAKVRHGRLLRGGGRLCSLACCPSPPPHSPLSQPPPPEAALPPAGAALGDDDSKPLSTPPSSDRPADSNPRGISGGAVDAAGAVVCASPAGLCISMSSIMGGGGGAVSLVIIIPMPSMPASSTPPNTALRPALAMPCRSCRKPPVSAPDAIAFHGSSCTDAGCQICPSALANAQGHTFLRTATSVQSNALNRPPHTAKLPPRLGAWKRIVCKSERNHQHT